MSDTPKRPGRQFLPALDFTEKTTPDARPLQKTEQAKRSTGPVPQAPPKRPSGVIPAVEAPPAPRPQRPITRDTLKAFLPAAATKGAKDLGKKLSLSDFGDEEVTAYDKLIGKGKRSATRDFVVPTTIPTFDGNEPAPGTDVRGSLAVSLAFVNGPDARSPAAYRAAIDQFAVAWNPRYLPEAGNASRAHVFVWDVTRALSVEVPHVLRGVEQTLSKTCTWLREHSAREGWVRVSLERGVEHASSGGPCLVMPSDLSWPALGIVRPDRDANGKAVIAAAGRKRGGELSLMDALGVLQVECYVHG
ncbi:MAG: hypothetical protein GQE15_01985 [Archangiaceae bacterium]|nr:hypothetical protein [Archangiaceae bacterium]